MKKASPLAALKKARDKARALQAGKKKGKRKPPYGYQC
jgi:hypothetical protein